MENDKEFYKQLRLSPIFFIEKTWGLVPQSMKPQYKKQFDEIIASDTREKWETNKREIKAEWFGDKQPDGTWKWLKFEKGKHISWQQYVVLLGIEKAIQGIAPKTITIASGRGIGKSTTLSWVMLWFLFCHPDCQIPCTAPGKTQMFDVLWKELAIWIHRMPEKLRKYYDWESSYVRINESPYTWFARAKTADKENPEALSGVHADHVMAIVDEASAVAEPIFTAAQGIFSSGNAYFIMISNPTRLNGYFRDSHTKNRRQWQCFQFSSEESPLVHPDLLEKYADEGLTADRYRINVMGQFPNEDALDAKSYVQLLSERDIKMIPIDTLRFATETAIGVDPAGEGDNYTAYAVRDNFMAYIPHREQQKNSMEIARDTITLADKYKTKAKNIIIDSFGAGADVAKDIALANRWNVKTVNVGELPEREQDREQFVNKKALMFWRLKLWLENGGMVVENKQLYDELLSIRFRRSLKGKIEIMQKREMRKLGLASPDMADALALTFLLNPAAFREAEVEAVEEANFDPFAVY